MGNCSGWGCPINVTVREGKAANLTRPDMKLPDGSPSPYQRICLKGYTNIERMYADTRLQYPLKRKGERGAGEWERISWDEALTKIASHLMETREKSRVRGRICKEILGRAL